MKIVDKHFGYKKFIKNLNLGDINVKKFGKKGDFLIKVEQKTENDNKLIPN